MVPTAARLALRYAGIGLLLFALVPSRLGAARSAGAGAESTVSPIALFQPRPSYPFECRRAGISGTVVIDFVVTPDGTTTAVRAVSSPDPRLSQAAVDCVEKSLFKPGIKDGKAVFTRLRVPITFALEAADPRLQTVKPDRLPRVVSTVPPRYPAEFASRQVEGEVLVKFVVCPDGTTADAIEVRSSDKRLISYALQAVLQWRFRPGTKEGKPVYCELEVPIVFKADAPKANAAPDAEFGAATDRESLLRKGNASLADKAYGDAAAAFSAAIESAPDMAQAYLGRAKAYAGEKRDEEAEEDYKRAAELDPADKADMDAFRASSADTPARQWATLRYETFDAVWRTVNDAYYDPTFGGVDWAGVREKYRLLLPMAADNAHLLALMQQMLGELRRSHFAIIPRTAAVFNPSERVRIGTVGVDVAWVDGGVVAAKVSANSKGERAPLNPGDEIVRIDGMALKDLGESLAKAGMSASKAHLYLTEFVESRLSAAVGTKISLVAAAPGVAAREISLTCVPTELPWSEPVGSFPSVPIQCSADLGKDGIAVLRFNVFVLPIMKSFRQLEKRLGPGDGLIIDLRGNGGGLTTIASGMSGWLSRDEFVLASMEQRTGTVEITVHPQAHAFAGPVAILIDGQSASTSEILAGGLMDHHRARIFGELSAGAALPSLFKALPTGDLMQFAVGDVKTPDGSLIEGNGVVPDEAVALTRADLAAGRDPVEDAARRWIEGDLRPAAAAGGAGKP